MDETGGYANDSSNKGCENVYTCVMASCIVTLSSVLAIVGNSLNIIVLTTRKFLTKPHAYFLISLAVADLLTGMVDSFSVYSSITYTWPYGEPFCLLTNYVREALLEISLLMILCLNLERYIAISYPFRSKIWLTKNRSKAFIFLCWFVTFAFKIYLFFDVVYIVEYDKDIYACTPEYDNYKGFAIFSSVAIEVPALIILTITSVKLIVALKRLNSRKHREMFHGSLQRRYSTNSRNLRKNLHGFKVLVVIATVSYISLLPSLSLRLLYISDNDEEEGAALNLSWALEFSFFWLASCGSFANVFVYYFMDRNFSRCLRDMLQELKRALKRKRTTVLSRGCPLKENGSPTNQPLSVISDNRLNSQACTNV